MLEINRAFSIEKSELCFLDLGGLGIRDLTNDGDDILVIAGPVSAASGPRLGMLLHPRSRYQARSAAIAARPQAWIPTGAEPARPTSQKLSPPRPFICG